MSQAARKLALPAMIALALVGVGVAAVVSAQAFAARAQIERQQAGKQLIDARQRLASVQSEALQIDERAARYESLVRRGVVGDENRLDWIEALERARAAAGMQHLRYTFAAPQTLEATAGVRTQASLITVDGEVPHEGHLLDFLDNLARAMRPHLSVRACTLARKSANATSTATTADAGLQVQCQFALITLIDPQQEHDAP